MSLRFCKKCENLMQPFINDEEQFVLKCHVCNNMEPTNENLIYQNTKNSNQILHPSVYQNICKDPALPRTNKIPCPKCNTKELVFFPHPKTAILQYICCKCYTKWECQS